MDKSVNRRTSLRLPFAARVICRVDGREQPCYGTLRDISITSLFVEFGDFPSSGQNCMLDIVLEGNHSHLRLGGIAGRVVRIDDEGVAIAFKERLEWFGLVPLYFHKGREVAIK